LSKTLAKKKKITLRHVKNWVLGITGLMVILMAISFTLIRVAIKSVPEYANAIQEAVSKELNIKLEVDVVDAEIYWLVPRLNLYNVNVYDASGEKLLIHANEIDLSLDWANSIRTMMPVISEITLDGLSIKIGVNKKNQLLVQGFVVNENIQSAIKVASQTASSLPSRISEDLLSDELQSMLNNLNFKIINSQINFYDERNARLNKTLNKFNLRLLNSGDEHKFEIQASLPGSYGNHLHVVMNIDGDLFDYKNLLGEIYVSVDDIRLAPWFDDYWNDSGFAVNANVYAQCWLSWEEMSITDVQGHFNLLNVGIHYLDETVNSWKLNQLDGRVHWERKSDGWQLDVRDLKSVRKGVNWPKATAAKIEMSDKNKEVHMQANFLRIEGLAYLAGMANSVIDEDIPWLDMLDKHQPSGDLHNLDVIVPLDSPQDIEVNTEFSNISFSLPNIEPVGIKNLQGSVVYLDKKTWLALESNNTEIKFNKLFRNNIELTTLRGALEISFIDKRLSVLTNSLYVDSPYVSTESRFHFTMRDGNPFLDLTTQYKNGNVKYTGLYLPADIMGYDTLAWLDKGLVSGNLVEGGYQIYGNLYDFPFSQFQGVSLADFNVSDVKLAYLDDWPVVNDISANVRILSDSLQVSASKGRVFDSNITGATAYIDNFKSPTLDVKINVKTELADITRFIAQSPFNTDKSSYINNIKLSGEGDLGLDLFIPLEDNSHVEWGGSLVTENGGVKFENEGFNLTNVNASIQFADAFFEASSVKALLDNNPLEIDLKTVSNSESKIYQFDIHGNLPAKSLMSPLPQLKKYVSGSADWDISIDLTQARFTDDSRLNLLLKSDLSGVSSELPGPLSKKPGDQVPLRVKIQKAAGPNMRYDLTLGRDKKIQVEEFSRHWIMSADAPSVKGVINVAKKGGVEQPVKVNLEYFDVNAFLKNKTHSSNKTSQVKAEIVPRDIPAIDFKAKQLIWENFKFNQAEVLTRQTRLGVVVDEFKLVANDYTAIGKGSWYSGWNKQHTTSFEFDAQIKNLGNAFKEIQITNDLEDTEGSSHMRLKWGDMPHNFSWDKLQGEGTFNLKDGTINQVDVGAGRVLGLFNLQTILSLDFANQVSDGFTFDKVRGSFSISGGHAYTDDLLVESKVADVSLVGEMNIEQATIDQTVRVRPHVESTVALGTAVIAGPAAGGLVYLFQKVFTPDRLSEYEYSIKGKIEDPIITLISVPADAPDEEEDDSDY